MNRQNPSARALEKISKSQESDISLICPEVPVNVLLPNLACGFDSWT